MYNKNLRCTKMKRLHSVPLQCNRCIIYELFTYFVSAQQTRKLIFQFIDHVSQKMTSLLQAVFRVRVVIYTDSRKRIRIRVQPKIWIQIRIHSFFLYLAWNFKYFFYNFLSVKTNVALGRTVYRSLMPKGGNWKIQYTVQCTSTNWIYVLFCC